MATIAAQAPALPTAPQTTHDQGPKKKVEAKFAPRKVYTEITKADTFYKAEDYHQDYYKKNEARYNFYRWNCGRDQRLEQLWGKKESS